MLSWDAIKYPIQRTVREGNARGWYSVQKTQAKKSLASNVSQGRNRAV